MAYIYADNLEDAFLALGFVTAQDRLFQMELTRLVAAGRISELVGAKTLPLDRRMRTIGIYRLAARHAAMLDAESRGLLEAYVAGVNTYIRAHADSHHLEFKLSGLLPEPWTVSDALSVLYYMSWSSSANIKTEIIAQMLIEKLGLSRAQRLFPLNINPDEVPPPGGSPTKTHAAAGVDPSIDARITGYLATAPGGIGSNNWAAGPRYAASGRPVVANDPHLDGRILPGPWYPCGLITPTLRIVGAHIPGVPVMPVFRSEHLAVGVTNAYGDVQDLYIETLDPLDGDRYMEGEHSRPFTIIEETLRYRDEKTPGVLAEEKLTIRTTRRGPVVSGVFKALGDEQVISLRWAAAEAAQPAFRIFDAMQARSVEAFQEAIRAWYAVSLNFVSADSQGNIGWIVSGQLPVRASGDGTVPLAVVDGSDNWTGWIPFAQMPRAVNPERGWLGTCNQKTVSADYPYYYSSYFSSSYRYRRLKALMQPARPLDTDDHYAFQRDTLNLMAARLAPILATALTTRDDTRDLGNILARWDFRDDPERIGPTVFHAVYNRLALRVFEDDLGPAGARTMLNVWYFWQERFQQMVESGTSPWFDDIRTADTEETLDDMIYRAGQDAYAMLVDRFGSDPDRWRWGRAHTIEFVNPVRREGFGKGLLGGGRHPAAGSVETLHRGIYHFETPFDVRISATLRMVADLGDADKVLAVMGGGVTGRVFHPHADDQIEAFLKGEKRFWWFSDTQIKAHAASELKLVP
jgi:penicillin amidase